MLVIRAAKRQPYFYGNTFSAVLKACLSSLLPAIQDEAPVLLVLLPTVPTDLAAQAWTVITAMLNLLQTRLAVAIRVIRIDAASHPAVVLSFDGQGLPAFVLLKYAIEV